VVKSESFLALLCSKHHSFFVTHYLLTWGKAVDCRRSQCSIPVVFNLCGPRPSAWRSASKA